MKKYFPILMLGIAAMLTSCSQEEMLQDATNHSRITTVTATISDGMKTRADATSEELAAITRCKLVAYAKGETTNPVADETVNVQNNNSFTFNLDLDEGEYDFYCWADDGSSYNLENGLENITVAEGKNPSIAHEGKITANSGSQVEITLKHAVAKVVLATTKDIAADKSASVTVQTYSGYNVFTESVTGNPESLSKIVTTTATAGASEEGPAEVLSFYVLVDKDEEPQASVTVAYDGDEIDVANVPIKADCRTILKGDLTALAYPETAVTATLDADWEEHNAEFSKKYSVDAETNTIVLSEAGNLTTDLIGQAVADGTNITLTLSGPMNDADAQALYDYFYGETSPKDTHVSTLDMSGVTGLATIKDETFRNATSLKKVILSASVTNISGSAFVGSGLETFTANHVTNVGGGAFGYCLNLTELSLPSVTTFGNGEFILAGCTSLATLKLTSPDFDGSFPPNFFSNTSTENVELYVHQKLKSNKSTVYSTTDGSITGYLFRNNYNSEDIEFKSITLVDDSGNPVDESTL